MKVIVESPYAGNIVLNVAYVRACMRDCALRGESPYASHALLTQPGVLRDEDPAERKLGIELGFKWRECADLTAVYTDFGITPGMEKGVEHARRIGHPVEERRLPSELIRQIYREVKADYEGVRPCEDLIAELKEIVT